MVDRLINLLIVLVCLLVAGFGLWRLLEHFMGLR